MLTTSGSGGDTTWDEGRDVWFGFGRIKFQPKTVGLAVLAEI